jgi:hypothetical protein
LAERARIVLASAAELKNKEIAAEMDVCAATAHGGIGAANA